MSDLMSGQVESYQKGYDKGFENGQKIGYMRGIEVMLEKMKALAIEIMDSINK